MLTDRASQSLMQDGACPFHWKADAAHEVLKARICTNRVPRGVNAQTSDVLALGVGFLERLQCQVLVSQPCVMQISRIG
jgi:hypothetical protein